jgi:lipid-A-disaccharide synthase
MKKKSKIFMIAGEASGDIYGGLFAKELNKLGDIELQGWGGENMKHAGVAIKKHYKELAFMGFWEVLKNIRTVLRNLSVCWKEIEDFKPDALVLVDFPGFNMRIAKKAKKAGIPVYQIVAPQVWAWKAGRVKELARNFTAVFPILPFEQDLLSSKGVNSQFMGHPLLDSLEANNNGNQKKENILALLPGSRKQEVSKILPVLIEAASRFTDLTPVVAGAPGLDISIYKLAEDNGIQVVFGKTRELLSKSSSAIITSGTATLEAAILNTKHVIAYKTNSFNFAIAKAVVKVDSIGLPNLILDKKFVPELIQGDCTADLIESSLRDALNSELQTEGFKEIRQLLGNSGASKRIAKFVAKDLEI